MPRRRWLKQNRRLVLGLLATAIVIAALSFGNGTSRLGSGVRRVSTDAFAPIKSGVEAITRPVGRFLAGAANYGALRQQNQKLQSEIDQLKMERIQAPFFKEDLKQLEALLAVKFVSHYETVITEVVGSDTDEQVTATIDVGVGSEMGVQVGMPVIGAKGLVGQVVTVGKNQSTVRLITDGQSQIGVTYGSGPADLTVAQGQGPGKPLVNSPTGVSRPIPVGQIMTTPDLTNSAFPPGIPVARVTSVSSGLSGGEEHLLMSPTADLVDPRYVAVVLYG